MNLSVDLQIACDEEEQPPPADIKQWVYAALSYPAINYQQAEAELTVRLVSSQEITQLNQQYRGKHAATNVLSFPADIPAHIDLPLLGDLVVCPAVVNREAREQGKQTTAHWAHMLIHGTLHLLGYDHIAEQQAELMEGLETDILRTLKFPDPYLWVDKNTNAHLSGGLHSKS